MKLLEPQPIDGTASILGEGPVWLEASSELVWVDIEGCKICYMNMKTRNIRTIQTKNRIGAAVPHRDGGMLCAMEDGIYLFDGKTSKFQQISNTESDQPSNRFNDGKCDPQGRFWAGTMSLVGDRSAGALYRMELDGTVNKVLDNIGCSNGLAWSVDGAEMYYIDTFSGNIKRFDYCLATGEISNMRVAAAIHTDFGYPDGMTIDCEGMLWIAHWGGGRVSRYNPYTGECMEEVHLPAKLITSCCFGGEELDELYITSARVGYTEKMLEQEPYAGYIFKYKPGVKGLPVQLADVTILTDK